MPRWKWASASRPRTSGTDMRARRWKSCWTSFSVACASSAWWHSSSLATSCACGCLRGWACSAAPTRMAMRCSRFRPTIGWRRQTRPATAKLAGLVPEGSRVVSSNTFGKLFSVTTFGESHGPAIGCVIDGCPPGIAIAPEEFVHDLARRATGKSRYTSQRHEADAVEILSGVYEGRTTGTPIALLIRNTDARSKDYADIAQTFRPGHADYTYWQKYGIRDPRGGGRASARETTMRVAAAVIAKKWLKERFGVEVRGWMAQMDDIAPDLTAGAAIDFAVVESNPFFWPVAEQVPELEARINALRKAGDSCGARINVVTIGVPPGWGEPVYGKL